MLLPGTLRDQPSSLKFIGKQLVCLDQGLPLEWCLVIGYARFPKQQLFFYVILDLALSVTIGALSLMVAFLMLLAI